jgi:mitogen-activated protein kinase kinase kinase
MVRSIPNSLSIDGLVRSIPNSLAIDGMVASHENGAQAQAYFKSIAAQHAKDVQWDSNDDDAATAAAAASGSNS